MRHQRGVTLLELVMVISIASSLYFFAIPGIQTIILKAKIISAVNQMSGLLQFARFSAINNNINSVVCPTINLKDCQYNDWTSMIMTFPDKDFDGYRDDDEDLLRVIQASDDQLIRTGPSRAIRFHSIGDLSSPSSIRICTSKDQQTMSRGIYLSLQGRVRLSTDANKDGIHENGNQIINCG
ncbi:GspH/FimT family pseudopilin [Glaciecola sp. 1036]|uniref:GspH/FimT family pseudopilin n=1 Tax=Alteromonadaceae TaxID=72275 RepID=UPI003CFF9ACA